MIVINDKVKDIMRLIESKGYHVYIVGGFVRDSIIGRSSEDYDLCTDMNLNELKEYIPYLSFMSQNDRRTTGIVNIDGLDIEITEIRGKDLEEDLFLRDLSINSIALDVNGNLYDPLNGVKDIQDGILKFNPGTIDYDPRAILRAIRFEGILGFELDEESKFEMYNKRNLLYRVTAERAQKELIKIIMSDRAGDILNKYKEIIFEIVPELYPLTKVNKGETDLFNYTMSVINNVDADKILRLSALFCNVGSSCDECVIKFSDFARRIKLDKNTVFDVKRIINAYHKQLSIDQKYMAIFIKDLGVENLDLLFQLKLADIQCNDEDLELYVNKINELRNTYISFLETKPVLGYKDLAINGRDLSQMNFDSKIVGIIMNDILVRVMNGELENKRNVLEEYADVKYR